MGKEDEERIASDIQATAVGEITSLNAAVTRCRLCRSPASGIPGAGHPLASVLILKGSPEKAEGATGVAFRGQTGDLVLDSLIRHDLDITTAYGANAVKCILDDPASGLEACLPFLSQELQIVRPQIIWVMGALALKALAVLTVKEERLPSKRGQVGDFLFPAANDAKVMLTFNPEKVLENNHLTGQFNDDVLALSRVVKES